MDRRNGSSNRQQISSTWLVDRATTHSPLHQIPWWNGRYDSKRNAQPIHRSICNAMDESARGAGGVKLNGAGAAIRIWKWKKMRVVSCVLDEIMKLISFEWRLSIHKYDVPLHPKHSMFLWPWWWLSCGLVFDKSRHRNSHSQQIDMRRTRSISPWRYRFERTANNRKTNGGYVIVQIIQIHSTHVITNLIDWFLFRSPQSACVQFPKSLVFFKIHYLVLSCSKHNNAKRTNRTIWRTQNISLTFA